MNDVRSYDYNSFVLNKFPKKIFSTGLLQVLLEWCLGFFNQLSERKISQKLLMSAGLILAPFKFLTIKAFVPEEMLQQNQYCH